MTLLVPQKIRRPGELGLTDDYTLVDDPRWCLALENWLITNRGLESRAGFINNTNKATGTVVNGTYWDGDGTANLIACTATTIQMAAGFGGAYSDISPGAAPTAGLWQFISFNGKLLAWQANHTPIVWTGSGSFANIAVNSGTQPDGNVALAAFGRVWATDDDEQTIRYSALLDETRWDAADGGGAIDMRNVWVDGDDEVIGLTTLGNSLVVIGRRHVVTWSDGQGNVLGVDPTELVVDDVILGTGLVYRDAMARVGNGDVWFWSPYGVQSLGRIILEKVNPLNVISWSQSTRLSRKAQNVDTAYMNYNPSHDIVTLTLSGGTYVFNVSVAQQVNGRILYPCTVWTSRNSGGLDPSASCGIRMVNAGDNNFLVVVAQDGLYKYSEEQATPRQEDDLDDAVSFERTITSAWFEPGPPGARAVPRRMQVIWQTDDPFTFSAADWFHFVRPYVPSSGFNTQPTREESRALGRNSNDPETEFQDMKMNIVDLGNPQESDAGPYQYYFAFDNSSTPGISIRVDNLTIEWAIDPRRRGGMPGGFGT